jgi:acetyl-CoA carboxylase carboxyltransferase component
MSDRPKAPDAPAEADARAAADRAPSRAEAPGALDRTRPLRDLATLAEKIERVQALEAAVEAGGGTRAIERLHARGKHTGKERIDMLVDPGSFTELDKFVGALRGVPRGNTITGHARIDGRPVVVISNMSESKAGAWYGESVFKMLRAQEFSWQHQIPLVILVDSASAYLPEQEEVHSGFRHGGRVFHYLANNSGLFPQVAAVFGQSVAGGAYIPGLADFVPMVAGSSAMFLAGPKLVQAAVGETVSAEELGGAKMHCRVSGVGDLECASEADALGSVRRFLSYLPTNHEGRAPRVATGDDIERGTAEIESILPNEARRAYDMTKLLSVVVDHGTLFELRPHYGKSLVCAFARFGGESVGVVASQPKHLGGVLDADAADKAAWFISICDAFNVPLVFFQDVPGFLVGSKAEMGGIIHAGARMVQAMARARVPRFTVLVRKAYGAGQYAMCGPGFEPTRVFALPCAESGTMAPEQLEQVVYGQAIAEASPERRAALEAERDAVVAHHRVALGADYAASKGWVDAIVAPSALRAVLCREIALSVEHYKPKPVRGRRSTSLT